MPRSVRSAGRVLRPNPFVLFGALVALAASGWATAGVQAADEGLADLDRATEVRLAATTLSDLDEVIRLTQSALDKGLDEGNTEFARAMLSSTLTQRGTVRARMVFGVSILDPRLAGFRKAALDDLERAVSIDPKQAEALLFIAQLHRLPDGDASRAAEALDEAVRHSADQPEVRARALVLRATLHEDVEKKMADLDEAVRVAPGLAAGYRARGLLRGDLGKLDESLEDLDKAVELEPEDVLVHQARAVVLGRLKRYDEALAALEEARKLMPDSVVPLVQQARLHAEQADLDAAMADLNKALEMEPGNVAVLLLRAAVEKDPEKKLADLNRAAELNPRNPVVLRARAILHAEQKRYEESLADFGKAIEIAPEDVVLQQAKAMVLAEMEKYDEALAALDRAEELAPDNVEVVVEKARIHVRRSDFEAALKELNRAHAAAADDAGVLLLRAAVHHELKQPEKAFADIDRALALEPGLVAALRLKAGLMAEAGMLNEAIAELERLVQVEPKNTLIRLQLAMLYAATKQYPKAIDAYTAVLAEEPEQWTAMRGRGDALLNVGKHAEAIADYEKALSLKDDDQGLLNNLAWVLATSPDEKLRDGKRAIGLATKACELTDYKMPHILSTLGATFAETGDFETALKWVNKGLELADDEEHREALEKELAYYEQKKPFRELLIDGKPVEEKENEGDAEGEKDKKEPEAKDKEKSEEDKEG